MSKISKILFFKRISFIIIPIALCVFINSNSYSQGTIFNSFKNDLKKADEYFANNDYDEAIKLYQDLADKNKGGPVLDLKLARTYYYLNNYKKAVEGFDKYTLTETLSTNDMLMYAESLTAISNYDEASLWYEKYADIYPNNRLIRKKIERLGNMEPLFEDSSLYVIKKLQVNTDFSELSAVPYSNGLVFLSDRKDPAGRKKGSSLENNFYYKLYFSEIIRDVSGTISTQKMREPELFLSELKSDYHQGPLSFYDNYKKMAFSANSDKNPKSNKKKTLHLFFAEEVNGKWFITHEFPYNSDEYSISDPAISQNGMVIYFTSDMKGGQGGKDLYKSEMRNGIWSQPVNLGPKINTYGDECYPFLLENNLYFASNGHPGLGGLDIFKTETGNDKNNTPQNLGYPINTNSDDFGIYIDKEEKQGYFSSNRDNKYYNDDIYVFKTSTQHFPVMINGFLKYKEKNSTGPSETKALPNTDLILIDHKRNVTVHESSSDSLGHFSIEVPYFSQYKIKIVEKSGNTSIVDLNILGHRQVEKMHEIIIVRDNSSLTD